jgi:hypothetical protein
VWQTNKQIKGACVQSTADAEWVTSIALCRSNSATITLIFSAKSVTDSSFVGRYDAATVLAFDPRGHHKKTQ